MRFLAFFIGLILPRAAHAFKSVQELGGGSPGISQMWNFTSLLPHVGGNVFVVSTKIIIDAVRWTIGGAAIIVILYAAIRMITSAGNDQTIQDAWKKTIFFACLGLVLTILSDEILNFIDNLVRTIAAS